MQTNKTLRINRALVLARWAAVVAPRLGLPRDTALTLGQALEGLPACSKGVRLDIYAAQAQRLHDPSQTLPKGVTKVRNVVLLG